MLTQWHDGSRMSLAPWRNFNDLSRELSGWLGELSEGECCGGAHLHIREDRDAIKVCAKLPGCKAEDVSVELVGDTLTLRAEVPETVPAKEERFLARERKFGMFEESVKLPGRVKADGVEAMFKHGVLRMTFPRVEPEKPRTIKVK